MKNYVVIGASSGIGKALAETLAKEGNRVFASYFQHEPQDNLFPELISYHYLDVREENLDLSFCPATVDGLAYCPGSINLKPFHRIKPEDFIEDYNLQVLGAVKVCQGLLAQLKEAEAPSILFFSTVAVQTGFTFHSQVSSSKGAIEGLSRALAAEFAPRIRVNAIAPSITNTPLAAKLLSSPEKIEANAQRHPLKKIGEAKDIAAMAAFLLSDKAAWISGQIISVDGGMSSLR